MGNVFVSHPEDFNTDDDRKPIVIEGSPISIKEFMKKYYNEVLDSEDLDIETFETLYPDIWTYPEEDLDERLTNGDTDLVLVRFVELDGTELLMYVETETTGGE